VKNSKLKNAFSAIAGACLLGFLWRARGTSGWGSSWGVLNAGFVFALFLNFAAKKNKYMSFPLITLAGLSFMLTCPAWGTLLSQITGILSVNSNTSDAVLYVISPFSGVIMMLCLGFGVASVYGVLIGRGMGNKEWRFKDYAAVLIVFIAVDLISKATVSHLMLKLIEPQAVSAFHEGLFAAGEDVTPYIAYMKHFSAVSWAKNFVGGRNYFSSVGTISLVFAAAAVFITTRFFVRDKYAAKTGFVICSAFAFSITLSDLFFFFDNGGYRMSQGFSLPENFAAWSLWEFFTGFIAGGIITLYLIKTAPAEDAPETLLKKLPEKPRDIFTFVLCVVGGIGLNTVRPFIRRIDNVPLMITTAALTVIVILALSFVYYRKKGVSLEKAPIERLSPLLCLIFTLYIFTVYMFIGRPAIGEIGQMHNVLFTVSAAAVTLYCALELKRVYGDQKYEDKTL